MNTVTGELYETGIPNARSFICSVFPAQVSDLSFMHIYGQRVQVPGAIIIDGVYLSLVSLQ